VAGQGAIATIASAPTISASITTYCVACSM